MWLNPNRAVVQNGLLESIQRCGACWVSLYLAAETNPSLGCFDKLEDAGTTSVRFVDVDTCVITTPEARHGDRSGCSYFTDFVNDLASDSQLM